MHASQQWGASLPQLMPSRRIDYILVRGFRHGRRGGPIEASLHFDGQHEPVVSDHYAVVVDLWNPPATGPHL